MSPLHHTNIEESKPTFRAHINLPKLQIQPLDGNPLEWLTFWDSFNNAVHNNPDLHNINKMNYLKSMITGDAARAISGLPITSQNYDKTIGMLQERFGRKQVLINAHMESLSKLNTPSMNVQQLRKFYDDCESSIRALETLGVQTDCHGSLLIPILLTQDLRNKLQLKTNQNETLDITTFGTTRSTTKTYEVVKFTLNALNEDIRIIALVTPIICPPLSNNVQLTEILPEFKTLNITDSVEEKNDHNIDILIGNDHYAQIIVGNTKKSKDERCGAIESKFGWLLSGPTPKMAQDKTFNTVCHIINVGPTKDDELNEALKKFWEVRKVPKEFCEDIVSRGD